MHRAADAVGACMCSKVELESLLIDRDRAATFSRLTGVQSGTGRTISYHQAQFMQFRDGKIVEYRGIIDSFDAAEQMIGHPIELSDTPRSDRRRRPGRDLAPAHAVAREHLAHRFDQLVFRHRELRLGLLLQVFVAVLAPAWRARRRGSGP